MLNYHFTCNEEDYIDYHFYCAVHDKATQIRLVLFVVGFCAAVILVKIVYFPSTVALFIAVALCLGYIVVFPKIYWRSVLKRISNETSKVTLNYPPVSCAIADDIKIDENGKKRSVDLNEITLIGWTKTSCLIFYRQNELNQTLILPLRSVSNMKELASQLMRGV